MKLIVGLGNPSREYQGTRHNVGFLVLAELAKQYGSGRPKAKFHGEVVDAAIGGVHPGGTFSPPGNASPVTADVLKGASGAQAPDRPPRAVAQDAEPRYGEVVADGVGRVEEPERGGDLFGHPPVRRPPGARFHRF